MECVFVREGWPDHKRLVKKKVDEGIKYEGAKL